MTTEIHGNARHAINLIRQLIAAVHEAPPELVGELQLGANEELRNVNTLTRISEVLDDYKGKARVVSKNKGSQT